ncbi:MAG TPA: substrate-binding domain-containing protein [Vicinamibacteria bacterium]|nr:substrate-binding domain-containing protein [Vicinamibacteria bacterium]
MTRRLLAVLLAGLAAAAACRKEPGSGPGGKTSFRIAVIPKGLTHEFWKSIHGGAVKASQELAAEGIAVEVIWKGPIREDDREQQIQVVEGFTTQGVDGIVLAPLDSKALVRPVEEAKRLGIPTVVIDSGLDSGEIVSFVATDNYKGGALAGQELGRLLGGKGKVLLLRYQEGSASTEERERGFLEKMKEAWPGVVVLSSDQYAGPTRDTAKRASENLLNRFGSDIQGIFAVNESATAGMLLALQDISRAGKVSFLGFDSSQPFVDAMRAKQLDGIVLQNPLRMGELGVRTMVRHLTGKPVEARVDTGVTLVTTANLDEPASQELIRPPFHRYLK